MVTIENLQQSDLPITTQPLTEVPELHSELEDEEEKEERKRTRKKDIEDCCCEPYYDPDEWEFYLFGQCIGWCCVQLGKCMENMFEGCSECITSCCDNEGGDTGGCEDVDCCDCNCFD